MTTKLQPTSLILAPVTGATAGFGAYFCVTHHVPIVSRTLYDFADALYPVAIRLEHPEWLNAPQLPVSVLAGASVSLAVVILTAAIRGYLRS